MCRLLFAKDLGSLLKSLRAMSPGKMWGQKSGEALPGARRRKARGASAKEASIHNVSPAEVSRLTADGNALPWDRDGCLVWPQGFARLLRREQACSSPAPVRTQCRADDDHFPTIDTFKSHVSKRDSERCPAQVLQQAYLPLLKWLIILPNDGFRKDVYQDNLRFRVYTTSLVHFFHGKDVEKP